MVFSRRTLAIAAWLIVSVAWRASATEIWYGLPQPRPDVAARLRANPGRAAGFLAGLDRAQADWDLLFAPGVLETLAPPMQVAQITTGFVQSMPEDQLARLAVLATRHVAIDYVAQPVVSTDPHCGNTEGYEDPRVLAAALDKLRRIGLPIRTLSLDEGLFFGHYYTGGQACRLSIEQTVKQVALTINAFRAVYPDIVVGEIMPTVPVTREPDWQSAIRAYRDGLAQATGKTLQYFQLDIAWETPSWQQSVVAETLLARSLGAGMGYIYNADDADQTDAAWLAHANRNIAQIEGGLGLDPVNVAFNSWNPHPSHNLGIPPGGTLEALMLDYARPGIRLQLSPSAAAVAGRVVDQAGLPLAGYRVVLHAAGAAAPGVGAAPGAAPGAPPGAPRSEPGLPEQQLSGVVPAEVHTATIALRINSECLCAGANRLRLGDIVYAEAGGLRHIGSFLPELRHFAAAGGAGVPVIRIEPGAAGDIADISALPDQTLLLNTRPFAVTPGAQYTLTAPVQDRLGTDMFGAVAIIWLGGPPGLGRANLQVRAQYQEVASAVTDAGGRFTFARPLDGEHRPAPLRLTVPDQRGHRAAIAELQPQ